MASPCVRAEPNPNPLTLPSRRVTTKAARRARAPAPSAAGDQYLKIWPGTLCGPLYAPTPPQTMLSLLLGTPSEPPKDERVLAAALAKITECSAPLAKRPRPVVPAP